MLPSEEAQLRHSALCVWPGLTGGVSAVVLQIVQQLQYLGYTGCFGNLDAESILDEWINAGWVELSPDRWSIRLKPDGVEQMARWKEEDRSWDARESVEVELPKRLKAGEPASNLRRMCAVIGVRLVECIHDPYTRVESLENILKLNELGTSFSPRLRLLRDSVKKKLEGQTLAGFLHDLNIEKKTHWELRVYAATERPHRRFLVCEDGGIVTCGLSLNNLDKDEALDLIPAGDPRAGHDREFFDEKWKAASVLQ